MDHSIIVNTSVLDNTVMQDIYSEFDGVRERMFSSVIDTREAQIRAALIKLGWTPPTEEERDCETCDGEGTIDERLGGEPFSNPVVPCPDCDGRGYWTKT